MSDVASSSGAPQGPATGADRAGDATNSQTLQAMDGDVFEAIRIANGRKSERSRTDGPVAESPAAMAAAEKPADVAETTGEASKSATLDGKETPKTEKEPSAGQWAKLHQRDKELTQRELKFKEEQKTLQSELESFKKTARTDKLAALKMLGYEDPIKFLEDIAETDGRSDPKTSALEQEVKALREEREAEKRQAQERQAAKEQAEAVDKVNGEIVNFLKSDQRFSKGLVSHPEGAKAIYSVMEEHYRKTGELMEIKQAADTIEKNWEAGLLQFANHPRGRELLMKALNQSAPALDGASQKSSSPKAPDRARMAEPVDVDRTGEKELAEATRWMKQRQHARRDA